MVFELGVEGLTEDGLVAEEQQVGALGQDVGEHQDHHGILPLGHQLLHHLKEFALPGHELFGVHAGDLADGQIVLGDVEILEVGENQLVGGLGEVAALGEDKLSQLVQIESGDSGHALGHPVIPLGAGGGLEDDGVGDDGGGQQAGQLAGGHQALLLVHPGDDRGRGADDLVAEVDGLIGLDVGQPVVIDDFDDFGLVEAGDRLGGLVVVHQHHALAAGTQQVEPGEGADDLFVFVQDGIVPVAALGDHLLDIVEEVVQMEAFQALPAADMVHGDGVVDQPGGADGVVGRGDNAGPGGNAPQRLGELGLTDDQAADVLLHGAAGHFGLVAAEDDGVLAVEQQILPAVGQGDGHLAGDGVHQVAGLVENLALEDAQQVEDGDLLGLRAGGDLHIEVGDFRRGNHAVEMPILVGDGDAGDIAVGLERLPGPGDGDAGVEGRGHVVVQVADLGAHGADEHRGLKFKPLENAVGLVADMAQPGGDKLPVAQGVAQGRVGDGGNDGISVRVAVSGDIDRVQWPLLLFRNSIS